MTFLSILKWQPTSTLFLALSRRTIYSLRQFRQRIFTLSSKRHCKQVNSPQIQVRWEQLKRRFKLNKIKVKILKQIMLVNLNFWRYLDWSKIWAALKEISPLKDFLRWTRPCLREWLVCQHFNSSQVLKIKIDLRFQMVIKGLKFLIDKIQAWDFKKRAWWKLLILKMILSEMKRMIIMEILVRIHISQLLQVVTQI